MLREYINKTELARLKEMLAESRNVVIVTHVSSDGDAIGSSLGMYEYLKLLGKDVTVIVPNSYPDFLHWMSNSEKVIQYDKHQERAKKIVDAADLICVLDLNESKRLENLAEPIVAAKAKKVLIDHHVGPEPFCDLTISYPGASSTCELIFRILDEFDAMGSYTKAGAEDLFAGMCTDTGIFCFNSNDPDVFTIIAELMKKGIDKDLIIRKIYNNYKASRFKMMGYVLYEKLVVMPGLNAAYYTLTKEEMKRFDFIRGDAEGIVNMPLEIKGMKLSISLREDTEKPRILVSLRSVDDFSARQMAEEYFNGGGHLHASGGQLYCTMDEAIKITEKAIRAHAKELMA